MELPVYAAIFERSPLWDESLSTLASCLRLLVGGRRVSVGMTHIDSIGGVQTHTHTHTHHCLSLTIHVSRNSVAYMYTGRLYIDLLFSADRCRVARRRAAELATEVIILLGGKVWPLLCTKTETDEGPACTARAQVTAFQAMNSPATA